MPPSMPSCYTYRAAILAVTCAPRGRVSADDTGYSLMSRSGDRSCTSIGETARPWVDSARTPPISRVTEPSGGLAGRRERGVRTRASRMKRRMRLFCYHVKVARESQNHIMLSWTLSESYHVYHGAVSCVIHITGS